MDSVFFAQCKLKFVLCMCNQKSSQRVQASAKADHYPDMVPDES